MFAQVIKGKVSDPEAVKTATERWVKAGPKRGRLAGLHRGNNGRRPVRHGCAFRVRGGGSPQQRSPRTGQMVGGDGEAVRRRCDLPGQLRRDSRPAGRPGHSWLRADHAGPCTDPERAKELMSKDADKWAAFRPDVIGSVTVGHDDGAYTMVLYFTSEAEAREGERKEVPPELQATMDEMNKISTGEPEFFDLRQPLILSPK